MTVRHVRGTDLAWALIDVVKPHLTTPERDDAFVTLGAGDSFAAVHQLLNLIATRRIPLRPHLVELCTTWLRPYDGHEEYDYLHNLIAGFLTADALTSTTTWRPQPAPIPRRLLTVSRRRPTKPLMSASSELV